MHAAHVAASASPTSSPAEILVLKKRDDFLRLSETGKKVSTKTIVLLCAPNELGSIRIGYTVSKKTSKLSVERNKIKRRLRAIVQDTFPNLAQAGFDYVIIGKQSCLSRQFSDLRGDVKYALKKMAAL